MSNRRKPKASRNNRPPQSALSGMFRRTCDQCGAPVEWVDAQRAVEHGLDVDEAVRWLGVPSADGLDIWICTRCDNVGVMGPTEFG